MPLGTPTDLKHPFTYPLLSVTIDSYTVLHLQKHRQLASNPKKPPPENVYSWQNAIEGRPTSGITALGGHACASEAGRLDELGCPSHPQWGS